MNTQKKDNKILSMALATVMLLVIVLIGLTYSTGVSADGGAGAGTGTPASPGPSGAPGPSGGPSQGGAKVEGIVSAYVLYKTEEIEVNAVKQVYYCPIKGSTVTSAKPSDLIPAAKKGTFELYYIDFSTISASKENYIGITTTTAPGADGLVPVMPVKIGAYQKKVEVNLKWGAEGDEASENGIVSSVVITNFDNTVVTYDHSGTNNETVKKIADLPLQWRKGANGEWQDISNLANYKWESMKNAGAVVYFRIDAIDQTGQKEGQRYSKEVKVKLATTKTPSLKLDSSKLIVGLKNGMQFRVSGSGPDAWKTILPFNAAATTEKALRDITLKTTFDAYSEATKAKQSYLGIDELYTALGIPEPTGTQGVSIDYRIAATTKKPASRVGVLTIPPQSAAPTAKVSYSSKGYLVEGITKDSSDLTENAAFEVTIVNETDLSSDKFDMASVKWSTVKNGTVLKPALKATYVLKDGARKTILITDKDSVILIRRKGISGSAKKATVMASKYLKLAVPAASSSNGTGTPTPDPSSTGTPTSDPSSTGTP